MEKNAITIENYKEFNNKNIMCDYISESEALAEREDWEEYIMEVFNEIIIRENPFI